MDALRNKPTTAKNNEYTRIHRKKFGVPTQHNHFTRSWTQGFFAQSVIHMNDQGYQHQKDNHVYIMTLGQSKLLIDFYLAKVDLLGHSRCPKKIVGWHKEWVKIDPKQICRRDK